MMTIADDTEVTDLPTFARVSPVPGEPATGAPWTATYEREAFIRLCELALEFARDDAMITATWLANCAGDCVEPIDNEAAFRCSLEGYFTPIRIDAEVILVRQRVEEA